MPTAWEQVITDPKTRRIAQVIALRLSRDLSLDITVGQAHEVAKAVVKELDSPASE